MRITGWILAGLLLPAPLAAQDATAADRQRLAASSLPAWAADRLAADTAFGARYEWSLAINPFYLVGDFDGDGRRDVAVSVRARESGKRGIALLRGAPSAPVVLGAGRDFGEGGDDFSWMDVWRVEDGPQGRDELYVEKSESASGAIRWTGHGYEWTQLGD